MLIELWKFRDRPPTDLDVAAARGRRALERVIEISHQITEHAREAMHDGRTHVTRAQLVLAQTYLEDALRNLERVLEQGRRQ